MTTFALAAVDRRVIVPAGRLCPCGTIAEQGHTCRYTEGRGWCLQCLADAGAEDCCSEERLARVRPRPTVTAVLADCGCPVDAACGHPPRKPFLVGTAQFGRRR
jgi:hypothetical protein